MGSRPRTALLTAGALLGVLAAIVLPGAATATPGSGGLAMAVHADDPLAPTVVLTNNTGAPCQVVTTAIGTVGITSVGQSGKQITPAVVTPTFTDGLDELLSADLTTLAPGASTSIPLIVAATSTGHVVEAVTAAGAAVLAEDFPVQTGGPLAVTATYGIPDITSTGAPLCPPAAAGSVDAVAGAVSRGGGVPLIFTVIAVIVLAILILIVVLLARRSRRAATAGAAALLILVAVCAQALTARPAYATLIPDPSLASAYGGCGGFNDDPAGILPSLNDPNNPIHIVPGDQTEEVDRNGVITIYWNPDDHHEYFGGGNADPCAALYHEMYHAWQDLNGGQDRRECYTADGRDTGIRINEVEATLVENRVRAREGLPLRVSYGRHYLPEGPCYPPGGVPSPSPTPTPTPTPSYPTSGCSISCGDVNADPHMRTFDGARYSFQGVGEFVAARDASDPGYQVQMRQQPAIDSTTVAFVTAVAMAVAGDKVEVDITADGALLLVNGAVTALGSTALPHGGTVILDTATVPASVDVAWPDGSKAVVAAFAHYGLHVTIRPGPTHAGRLVGLLGNDDGNPGNDLVAAGKTLAVPPDFGALYPAFADHWRITGATSLFTYPAGATTATYTDRSFPAAPSNLAGLPGAAAARVLCQSLGITDPQTLDDCVLDFAETGQAAFAVADLATQNLLGVGGPGQTGTGTPPVIVPTAPTTGPTTSQSLGTSQDATLRVTQPHGVDKLTFPATTGERLFVDILSSTAPDQCGLVSAYRPDGTGLGTTCTTHGTGDFGGFLLAATGTYSVVFAPANGATGQVHVRITLSTDVHSTLPVDGTPTTVSISQPGQVGYFSFHGTLGDRVAVEATGGTIPDECGIPTLWSPDNVVIGVGCLSQGAGYVDGVILTTSGQFTVVVDPGDTGTGQLTLRVIVSHDVHGTITLGGPTVVATIASPGQVAQYTFLGTKGEKVAVIVTAGTLPPQCGLPSLRTPDGGVLTSGCTEAGDSGGIEPIVLPSGGTYTVEVNPDGLATGTLTIELRTG